ncbi:delta-like protein 2 [Elysia marginata]|uniref:Delta-like protein 2 n=1 Tax=Elysia marginata TaxID=1093978 RepID=A0AAV4H4K6_9GAST|nr:delta-like protein 2 [Elysia marginata]
MYLIGRLRPVSVGDAVNLTGRVIIRIRRVFGHEDQGTVHLVESRDFRAVVNITAPSLQEAYDVHADLFTHRGRLVLEIKQNHVVNGMISYIWLLVGMACATVCVGICTTVYVVRWYEQERQPYELVDHRSYASSSQRGGVYRPGNTIPMVNLAPGGPGREFGAAPGRGLVTGEDGNLRGEEELRQVQEMPEEEEAEAREMEEHHKLKMMKKEKEALATAADSTSGDATQDSDDPHERNLIMSRFNSQSKTLHKDLLSTNKKTSSPAQVSPGITVGGGGGGGVGSLGRRLLAYRRTQDGTYEGVPGADPDDPVNSKEKIGGIEEISDDESESLSSSSKQGSSRSRLVSPPPNYAAATADDTKKPLEKGNNAGRRSPQVVSGRRVKMEPGKDVKFTTFSGGRSAKPEEPKYANDPSENDPLLILADVHKTTSDPPDDDSKTGGILTGKDNTRLENVYINPSQMKRNTPPPPLPKLSTFGPPKTSSTPKVRSGLSPSRAGTSDQDPWVLNSMSDIAEDPKEDDQSVVSGSGRSGKSNSMYGSSEIFDSGEYRALGPGGIADFYDSLLDSDVEVPPLDAEDGGLLSDGGLPSPLGFPSFRGGDKGKVNDDIKLIPGALKSPGAHVGHQVNPSAKPRPHSSFIYRPSLPMSPVTPNPTTKGKPMSSKAAPLEPTSSFSAAALDTKTEDSPPLPPLPPYPVVVGGAIASIDDESQSASSTAEGSVFQFPPPPSLCQPESSNGNGAKVGGEYVHIKGSKVKGYQPELIADTPQAVGRGRGGGRGGRKLFGAGTYMNVAILSTLCLLTVVGGVYSSFLSHSDETRVDLTIFAPRQFLGNTTRIFLNYHKDTDVVDGVTGSRIRIFDVERPLIDPKTKRGACANKSCDHTCDEATGLCACLKGYKSLDEFRCIDVNECMEGKVRCDPYAGCLNRKGSYDCICGEDFYGNGKTCRECTQICRPGYYMAQPCMARENAICRVCRPECGEGEFESRQCSTHHDRECRNATLLQQPMASENLILEDRGHVTETGTRLDKLPAEYVGFTNYQLHRGTGVYIDLTVIYIEAAQEFLPVNDSRPLNFDLKVDAPDVLNSYLVQRFCPYPLPDYYNLRFEKREGVTYKQHLNGTITPCDFSSSSDFVGGARIRYSQPNSFSCSQPGGLTDIFSVDENFFLARSKWVDKSRRCQRQSDECEQCTTSCGINMGDEDPLCKVKGDHGDNGFSPRLRMCYNCCVKKKCTNLCKDYHMNKCQPQQCTKGNLLQFSLEPTWASSQEGRFFCHIRPRPNQYLVKLKYSIRVQRRSQATRSRDNRGRGRTSGRRGRGQNSQEDDLVIHKSTIEIKGDDDWIKFGAMKYSDGILNFLVNSSLGKPPDFLEGQIQPQSSLFKVGDYRSKGSRLANSYIQSQQVLLRPPTPHGTPAMPDAHQECSLPKLDDMLFTSEMENPYNRRRNLEAYVENNSLPYFMKSKETPPVVMATVSQDTAILRRLYVPVRLREESFRGDVTHNGSHWVIEISGEVTSCPGYIRVKLADPERASSPLFDCDTAILCPNAFNLTFALPTSDLEDMYKDVLIQIKDNRHEHNFRLFRRTSLEEQREEEDIAKELNSLKAKTAFDPNAQAFQQVATKDETGNTDSGSQDGTSGTPNLPLPIYALLIIAGGILLLLVLAIIGQCFLADFPIPDTPYAQVHHAFFAVCYMLMQFVYSIFISGTAFFLILTIITHRDVTFIVRHGQPGAVSTAASNIELLRLQRHLEGEITRQDALADAAQEVCIDDVEKISRDMKRLHDALLNSTKDVFEKHRLDLLLTQQKVHVRHKLSRDLHKFRESYAKAAKAVLKQVNQNAQASYQNVAENNTWLVGARYLYGFVKLRRDTHRKPVKTFMEWTGIRAELEKLEIDLSFSLPALPRLDDIPAPPPQKQPVKRDSGSDLPNLEPIRSIQMHNNWFFPVEEMGIGGAASFISIDEEEMTQTATAQSATSAAFFVFLTLLALCDLVLLGHRMCRAWTTAKLCVYGFPEYFRENKGQLHSVSLGFVFDLYLHRRFW